MINLEFQFGGFVLFTTCRVQKFSLHDVAHGPSFVVPSPDLFEGDFVGFPLQVCRK